MKKGCIWPVVIGMVLLAYPVCLALDIDPFYALLPLMIPFALIGFVIVLFIFGIFTGKVHRM